MTYYGAGDLDIMLNEFGVPVLWSGIEAKGILDESDVQMLTGEGATFLAHQTSLLTRTGDLAGIASGALLTVDDRPYKVTQVTQEGDGALTRLMLAKEGW